MRSRRLLSRTARSNNHTPGGGRPASGPVKHAWNLAAMATSRRTRKSPPPGSWHDTRRHFAGNRGELVTLAAANTLRRSSRLRISSTRRSRAAWEWSIAMDRTGATDG